MYAPFSLQQTFLPNGQVCDNYAKSYWFIYCQEKLALYSDATSHTIPIMENLPFADSDMLYCRSIGIYNQKQCLVVEICDSTLLPGDLTLVPLREAYQLISPDLWTIAGRAVQFLHWHSEHRFCGKCGNEMVELQSEPAKKCPNCDFLAYPRLTPAVIMSVTWNNKILLGRTACFPKGMYCPLSGFVEAGEILEEAVRREIMEEAGIEVADIQYVASQPWPFPQSLMLGFTARYQSGEIKVDTTELEDARWFSAEAMPERLPSRMSIARILIDQFLDGKHPAPHSRSSNTPTRSQKSVDNNGFFDDSWQTDSGK